MEIAPRPISFFNVTNNHHAAILVMFSRVVASVLRSLVGDYVEGINRENLNLGLRKGDVTLKNLKIKTTALDALDTPFSVKAGTVGTLRAKVPWTHLTSKPVTLALEDVVITVGKDTLNELVALERINKRDLPCLDRCDHSFLWRKFKRRGRQIKPRPSLHVLGRSSLFHTAGHSYQCH